LLIVGFFLSVRTFEFLVVLVTLSGAGALQLMPGIMGVCFPGRRLMTRSGILAGLGVGLTALYVTLWVTPHPLGMHGGIWSLVINWSVALVVSRYTRPPSPETVMRIHGEIERFVYGGEESVS
ncbi:MAG: hypothetical protein KAJ42_06505, partial [Gemmatimonadetes bacterium]|nr:hypothetical protein [Gemmatimonadota bacterium]